MNYEPSPELANLLGLLLDDRISIEDNDRLAEIISADSGARAFYRELINTHALMVWQVRPVGSLIDDETDAERADSTPPGEDFNPQPIILDLSSPVNASAPFVGGWAFSYAVATVFVCMLLLGFWAYKLPSDRGSSTASNENRREATAPGASPHDRPPPVFVGRVTGIAGAKWSDDPDYIAPISVRVALGRQYKLKSGLLEITYDSGAKVILEGPCSYKVESTGGGYLALGKLVARVGARGRGRGTGEAADGQRPVTSMKDEGGRPNAASLPTTHYPLSTNSNPQSPTPNPLFAVRTPTAVVTDLGTEFGVEVAVNGDTTSFVFEGTVVVQAGIREVGDSVIGNSEIGDSGIGDSDKRPATAVAGGQSHQSVTLVAGESVRVGRVDATHQEPTAGAMVRFTHPTAPPQFSRRLPKPPKELDLLDIVAGGNGMGDRRERGIDPTSGLTDPMFVAESREGDDLYRRLEWQRFIDGVFVPNGAAGAVRLDSAGHVFDGFPQTCGTSWGSIWSRAAEVSRWERSIDEKRWLHAEWDDARFMPRRRGLLGFCSNTGITFDLAAVRRAYPGALPRAFRAMAGIPDLRQVCPDADGLVDLWVFVDGRLLFERKQLRPSDGVLELDVPLTDSDNYLTLAVTDGGDKHAYAWDWVVFGDPVLEMSTIND